MSRRHGRQLVRQDRPHEPRSSVVRPRLHRRQTGERLDERVVHRCLRERSAVPESADRDVDDRGGSLADRGFADAHPFGDSRPMILQEHVRPGGQSLQHLDSAFVLQVEGDRALVAVVVQEERGEAASRVRRGAGQIAAGPGILDLDDVRALIAENLRGERPGDHRREVENAEAAERSGHVRAPRERRRSARRGAPARAQTPVIFTEARARWRRFRLSSSAVTASR
jgi:hypothetical protein